MTEKTQSLSFNLITKEGAKLEFQASNLLQAQMNNILNNIIKPNIAPVQQTKILTMSGKKRALINDLVQKSNPITEPIEMETLPVIDLSESRIINEEQEDLADKLKAEELNDLVIKSKDVSVIDSPRRATASMADLLGNKNLQKLYDTNPPARAEEKPETEFHHTGIKYNGDKPKYRVGYECPRCYNSGRHYIPKFVTEVSCHNCQSSLEVVPATEKGFGHGEEYRDKNGNFFVANTLVMDRPLYDKKVGN